MQTWRLKRGARLSLGIDGADGTVWLGIDDKGDRGQTNLFPLVRDEVEQFARFFAAAVVELDKVAATQPEAEESEAK